MDQTGSMMMVKLTAPDGREETLMTTARQYFTVLADLDHNVAGNKSPPSIETGEQAQLVSGCNSCAFHRCRLLSKECIGSGVVKLVMVTIVTACKVAF